MKKLLLSFVLFFMFSLVSKAQGPSYPYSVTNTWVLSISPNITGQNIYRAPYISNACSMFTKLNTTPLPATTTSYSDQNPPEGAYCYGVTATNANTESGMSNIQSNINVPPPPPTKFGAVVAKNGTNYDVIYAWTNPTGTLSDNTIYCGTTKATIATIKVYFPTTKVRVTSPVGTDICAVTATNTYGESGLSNQVSVVVP